MTDTSYPRRYSSDLSPGGYPLAAEPVNGTLYPFVMKPKLKSPISDLDRKRISQLRRFAKTPPAYAAVQQITNSVTDMTWSILPPINEMGNDVSLAICAMIADSFQKPNRETLGRYRHFIAAIVDELLTLNSAYIERQPGDEDHLIWMWTADSAKTKLNPRWSPYADAQVSKFLDTGSKVLKGIMAENMFLILGNINVYEAIPPSPLEIAFGMIESWLGLNDYQQGMTSNSTAQWMLDLGDVDATQLDAFRAYWNAEVKGSGSMPIGAGKGMIKAVKIGATDDGSLYPLYCEYLLRMIALAFQLSARDTNITEPDNKGTAGVSADQTFANAVKPMAKTIFQALEIEVVDFYFPGYRIKVDYSEPRSQGAREALILSKFEKGVISRNETRIALGHDPLPDSQDVFSNELKLAVTDPS